MFKESNLNYPINRDFFLFSFALFFLAYWILLNSALDLLAILPALALALGSSVLLYSVFSILGWAPPLLHHLKFLRMPRLNVKMNALMNVGKLSVEKIGIAKKLKKSRKAAPRGKKIKR